jgi:hypothetical protein
VRERPVLAASEIEHGWLAVDADGANVGKVAALEGDFLVISRGFLSSPLYVPLTGVRDVIQGEIQLTLTIDQIHGSRWMEKPRQDR